MAKKAPIAAANGAQQPDLPAQHHRQRALQRIEQEVAAARSLRPVRSTLVAPEYWPEPMCGCRRVPASWSAPGRTGSTEQIAEHETFGRSTGKRSR